MVSTAGGIIIAIIVLALAAAVGWIVFSQMRARRLGLPPPPLSSYIPGLRSDSGYGAPRPAAGGLVGWVNDQVRKFKTRNARSAAGAYEQPLAGGAGPRRGFGPLDPDEAWDARVGAEPDSYGYYEEAGTGPDAAAGSYVMHTPNPYGQDDDGDDDDAAAGRIASRGRMPTRLGERNPFDDDAAASLRGASPRPMQSGPHDDRRPGVPSSRTSSPSNRRSMFTEQV